jgi:hypothetical protein
LSDSVHLGVLTVYLDQNIWIELAKALYRADATPEARRNAEKLKETVAAGCLRCPVGEIHLMEAYRIGDRDRRLQLASVFAAFSGGWFIAGRQARVAYELDAALWKLLSIPNASDQQPFDAFAQNFLWAFGDIAHLSTLISISPQRLDQISASIGPINALLSHVGFNDENVRRTSVVRMQASNADLIDRIRARRALTKSEAGDMRFRAYSAQLFLDVQDKIEAALRKMGKSFADLRALPDEKIASLIDLVPCWDIERCLAVQVEQQWNRELEGNDTYDIGGLTAGIPYCDVVVTERLWTHLCNASGVAARYNSRVISSVFEITSLLA